MLIFAYLTLFAIAGIAVLFILLLIRSFLKIDLISIIPTRILVFLENNYLWLAFAVALFATLGSLYFSELQGLPPCQLCWYQRIFMYPMTIIFFIAALRKDKNVLRYILPLVSFGLLIALYQVYIQAFPDSAIACIANGISCSNVNVSYFGFITIPVMSVVSFLLILIATILPQLNLTSS